MAPRKKSKLDPRVRTGGAVGDDAMDRMCDYNDDGAGVDEKIKNVNGDPNADLPARRMKGSEA